MDMINVLEDIKSLSDGCLSNDDRADIQYVIVCVPQT